MPCWLKDTLILWNASKQRKASPRFGARLWRSNIYQQFYHHLCLPAHKKRKKKKSCDCWLNQKLLIIWNNLGASLHLLTSRDAYLSRSLVSICSIVKTWHLHALHDANEMSTKSMTTTVFLLLMYYLNKLLEQELYVQEQEVLVLRAFSVPYTV